MDPGGTSGLPLVGLIGFWSTSTHHSVVTFHGLVAPSNPFVYIGLRFYLRELAWMLEDIFRRSLQYA